MNPVRVAFLATVLVLASTVAVVGAGGSDEPYEREVRIVDEEIVVADGVLTISDTTLEGPGLGERHVEDRTYTVDSTLRFDGFHVTHDGTRYTVCRVTVHVQDVGVRLQNVTLTEGGTDSASECDC